VNFCARARCAGFIALGFIDTTCPPTGVYAAYNSLTGPKQVFNSPSSPHDVTQKMREAIRQAILAHVEQMRRPPGQ
jgi:cephalosporin-C deacetylase-like acetyl esterase